MYDSFTAAIPEPVSILGVSLLPLSLGRYRLLRRFNCAFVAEGEATANAGDLLLGILICSMPCAEFLEAMNYRIGSLKRQMRRWGKRIRKEIKHDPYFSLLEKHALFRMYVEDASRIPPYWDEKGDGGGQSASHWSVAVEVTMRSNLGYSQEEIEEAPLSKVLLDYFKYAENQGSIRLIAPGEIEAGESNAKVFEQLLKDHPELAKQAQASQ